jgi:magnesium-protoporphyrin O-methyltransferase
MSVAREEAERRGHSARVSFLQGDFVDLADTIAGADVVTLDRVICCYPDMSRLVNLSSAKAARLYGAVYPRRVPWMAFALAGINLLMRLKKSAFRVFLHDPLDIDAVLRRNGFARRSLQRTIAWEVALYERHPAP